MKLVWSPETASMAYLDTVKSCEIFQESGVAELVSAMAAGWNAKLVVETWSGGGAIATSVGLAVATGHTEGRHICIVADEESGAEYSDRMRRSGFTGYEMIVGEAEAAMGGLEGIDFLVVDGKGDNFATVVKGAKLGERGAVLVCKNASSRAAASDFRWRSVVDGKSRRMVRSVFLPVGKGLDIAHVGAVGGETETVGKGKRKWIKSIDRRSGEEIVIKK